MVHVPATVPAWCNISELKGIHYAMHAGMYAAEAIIDSLKEDSVNFEAYDEKVRKSMIAEDLYKWRNMRQSFSKGFFVGGVVANAAMLTKGLLPPGRWDQHEDSKEEMAIDGAARSIRSPTASTRSTSSPRSSPRATRPATTRRTTSGSRRTCRLRWRRPGSRCARRRSTRSRRTSSPTAHAEVDVHVTPSNCVQCGAITAKGGRLTPPEGGDGPLYQEA